MTGWKNISSRRSTVLSRHGAVATNNPIATEVGISLLKRGANAAEASVGIAAVLNVVDPGSTGLGGDCFVMFYDAKTKKVKGLNGSGRSPSKLTLELLNENGISSSNGYTAIPSSSGFSVTIPGAAAAWLDTIEIFGNGKMSVDNIFQPAICVAEEGYPTHEFSAWCQIKNVDILQQTSYSFASDLLVNDAPPQHGQVVKNLNLANVYKALCKNGKDGFYDGWVAQSIVNTVKSAGGCMELCDLKNHTSTFEDPISTVYHGIRVWEMPPNGQGLVALMGLNILEDIKLTDYDRLSAECLHQMVEATKLSIADGNKYIADPSINKIPIDALLSKNYAKKRRDLIQPNVASYFDASSQSTGNDTVYFSVVDQAGNACSFINSIYNYNGSGLVPKDCGFILQSRGNNFNLDESHMNCVGPNKRSYHTIIPGMATYAFNDDLYACFGVMGGFMQPQGHMQVLTNMIDFDMDPQVALCFPRYFVKYSPESSIPVVLLEDGISEDTVEKLKRYGHHVENVVGMDRIIFGRGQIIQVRKDSEGYKVLWSGSESRADGCAMGY